MGKLLLCGAWTDGRVGVRRVERVSMDSGKLFLLTRIGQKMCNHHLPAHHCSETTLFAPFRLLHTSVAGQKPYKWLVAVIVNSQVSLMAQRDA